MNLTLGFSPCPNDTFIFDTLVNGGLDTGDVSFEIFLEDVETLNCWAAAGKLDITKLSYAAFGNLQDKYQLLKVGSALGRGVGPLLISKPEADTQNKTPIELSAWLKSATIAIPGRDTTANKLLSLAFPEATNKQEIVFSEIEAAVLSGRADAGLIIHENRFTYADRGLHKIIDLGEWWEKTTGAPIPLGGIVARKNLPPALIPKLETWMRQSLELSWQQWPQLSDYVKSHAQEMEESVMRQHIELYVNSYTMDLGEEGKKAVGMLLAAGG